MLRLISLISIYTHYDIILPMNAADCSIDITSYNPEPVIVSSDKYEVLYPPINETKIIVPHNTSILIACPGSKLTIGGSVRKVTCVGAHTFRAFDREFPLPGKLCTKPSRHIGRYTGSACGLNGREMEIGFQLDRLRFSRMILICFDKSLQSPLYASYKLTKSILKKELYAAKSFFIQSHFMYDKIKNTTLKQLYSKINQRMMINKLAGLQENSSKYVKDYGGYYLVRGHLGGKGDFMYIYQQTATYYYVNCAPQWSNFNNRNWQSIEYDIRYYASKYKADLDIYSGIYGVSTLFHEVNHKAIELYLYVDEITGEKALPIPDIFWKVVYNPKTKQGITFVLHNNLYDKHVNQRYICNDVSKQITWFRRLNESLTFGHGYACTLESLRNVINYVPNLDVKSLMT